jgi:hypothetical protein
MENNTVKVGLLIPKGKHGKEVGKMETESSGIIIIRGKKLDRYL